MIHIKVNAGNTGLSFTVFINCAVNIESLFISDIRKYTFNSIEENLPHY